MMYLELTQQEVEFVSLTRDTTETDLKQRREIRDGSAHYIDQAAVLAAVNGRVLVLEGIEKADTDKMMAAFGRHARSIELGRALWATPPLDDEEACSAQAEDFRRGQFPSAQDATKAVQEATKEDVERPRP